MIRTWSLFILAIFLSALLSSPARSQGKTEKNDSENINAILSELKQLRTDMSLMRERMTLKAKDDEGAISDLNRRLTNLEGNCVREITRLNNRLDQMNPPNARISGTVDVAPLTGRINLINDWDSTVTYYINSRPYVLGARQQLPLDVPAGPVNYQIVGDGYGVIEPLRTLTLNGGQTMNVQVYRR